MQGYALMVPIVQKIYLREWKKPYVSVLLMWEEYRKDNPNSINTIAFMLNRKNETIVDGVIQKGNRTIAKKTV